MISNPFRDAGGARNLINSRRHVPSVDAPDETYLRGNVRNEEVAGVRYRLVESPLASDWQGPSRYERSFQIRYSLTVIFPSFSLLLTHRLSKYKYEDPSASLRMKQEQGISHKQLEGVAHSVDVLMFLEIVFVR